MDVNQRVGTNGVSGTTVVHDPGGGIPFSVQVSGRPSFGGEAALHRRSSVSTAAARTTTRRRIVRRSTTGGPGRDARGTVRAVHCSKARALTGVLPRCVGARRLSVSETLD